MMMREEECCDSGQKNVEKGVAELSRIPCSHIFCFETRVLDMVYIVTKGNSSSLSLEPIPSIFDLTDCYIIRQPRERFFRMLFGGGRNVMSQITQPPPLLPFFFPSPIASSSYCVCSVSLVCSEKEKKKRRGKQFTHSRKAIPSFFCQPAPSLLHSTSTPKPHASLHPSMHPS